VPRLRIEPNVTAIDRYGPLHDGQAEACSAIRARFVNPVESPKHFVSVLNGDTGPAILKCDQHRIVIDPHVNVNASPDRRVLYCIVQKVDYCLAQY
jgi:hypothetical protein